jgi:hypothetical protein
MACEHTSLICKVLLSKVYHLVRQHREGVLYSHASLFATVADRLDIDTHSSVAIWSLGVVSGFEG